MRNSAKSQKNAALLLHITLKHLEPVVRAAAGHEPGLGPITTQDPLLVTLEVVERCFAATDVPHLEDHVVRAGDEVVVVCLAPVHARDPARVRCVLGADNHAVFRSER